MQLPEHYWDDVNRYTSEILAGIPITVEKHPPMTREEVVYKWDAQEEDAEALLRRDSLRILGFTIIHYHLGIRRTEPDETSVTHFIRFDPKDNRIVRVQDDIYSLGMKRL